MTILYTDTSGARREYPQSFDLGDLKKLEKLVLSREHATMIEVVESGSQATVVRHDVDHSLDYALRFSMWEAERGITSTYFILHTAWYFRDFEKVQDRCHQIASLGHEIGIHHDATTAARRQGRRADAILLETVGAMRSAGLTIRGCAAHASEIGLDNMGVWDKWELSDFGFEYEAYKVHGEMHANYISDNRGVLREPLRHIGGRPTHLLVHPEHWRLP